MEKNKKIQGKKNRESGARFERKVRADLESRGWIVDRWTNNVFCPEELSPVYKLQSAKSRFNMRTTGFPDFVVFRKTDQHIAYSDIESNLNFKGGEYADNPFLHEIIGVEVRSSGYLTKEEKAKCKWLLDHNVFSKILIAKKGKRRSEIELNDFQEI